MSKCQPDHKPKKFSLFTSNKHPTIFYLPISLSYTFINIKKNTTIITLPMIDNPLPPLPGPDAPPGSRPLPVLLNETVSPSPEQVQAQPQLLQGMIKTIRLCLPHPSSLDVLPSPTNKWSVTTHPIKGKNFGFINSAISYQHLYFPQSHVLHTKAFTTSTTATTVCSGLEITRQKSRTEFNKPIESRGKLTHPRHLSI